MNINNILKLKDELTGNCVSWKEDSDDIIIDHFRILFEYSGKRDLSSVLHWVDCKVDGSMNKVMCRLINDAEFLRVVTELGALKSPGPDGFSGTFFSKKLEICWLWSVWGCQNFFQLGIYAERVK